MLVQERRNKILERLQNEKKVVVSTLAQEFLVSEETIRRDLEKLERQGLCTKSYGGATFNEDLALELPFGVRKMHNVVGKQRMADQVASLIHEGQSLFLDASTTAVYVARRLKAFDHLTVLTNSMEILLELSDKENWTLIGIGGLLQGRHLCMVGPKAQEVIQSYNADASIISCKALSLEKGMCESREDILMVKKAMLAQGGVKILVAEASKFDQTAFAANPDLSQLNYLVSDEPPSPRWERSFARLGITCLYPKNERSET